MERSAVSYEHYPTDQLPPEIEERLHRIEEAVAALQDTGIVEARVVERVIERLKSNSGAPLSAAQEASAARVGQETAEAPRWFLLELWYELRAMVRMIADHRFKLSLTAKIVPILILVVYLLTAFLSSSIPLVGWAFERVVDIVLVVMLYVILSREARRYRETYGDNWRRS